MPANGCYDLIPRDPYVELQTSIFSKKLFTVRGHWKISLGCNVNLNKLILVGKGV